ncbi:tail fiber domain-containing protein [Phocaeicola abscessus]
MKRCYVLRAVLALILVLFCLSSVKVQLFYQDSHLFIGPKPTNWASSGNSPEVYLGPNWGIDFSENGLNFWRPFGSSNWGNCKLLIDQSGKIGIGRKPITHALEVNGRVWTTQGLLITSDERLKRNIVDINGMCLSKPAKLNGKFYEKQISSETDRRKIVMKMLSEGKINNEESQAALSSLSRVADGDSYKKEFGFMAQEVKELFPELVEQDADGIYAVNYTGFTPILVEAIKELQVKIKALENNGQVSLRSGEKSVSSYGDNIVGEEYLSQNAPNPIENSSKIIYSLPEGTTSAAISFYSINGAEVKNVLLDVNVRSGSITVTSADFATGLYVYKLIANNVLLGFKKLISKQTP